MAQTQSEKNTKAQDRTVVDEAAEGIHSMFDAGARFQRDFARLMFPGFGASRDGDNPWGRFERAATDSFEVARKSAEQAQKSFDESCRFGLDAVEKSFKVADAKNADPFETGRSVWKNGAEAVCSTMETVGRTNVRMIENWASFLNQNFGPTAEKTPSN